MKNKEDYEKETEYRNVDLQLSDNNQVEETHEFREWLKRNKRKVILWGSTTVVVVGGILIYKNRKSVMSMFTGAKQTLSNVDKSVFTEKVVDASIEAKKKLIDDMVVSSERLTARAIGDKMLCSAQEVNKRLIRAGFADRHPYGDVIKTELGAKLGEEVVKTTRYGYTFSNIEWSESVIPLIFSEDEIDRVNQLKEPAKSIVFG